MKALILNSGLGTRMGDVTKTHPKCMTELCNGETILSRQIRLLEKNGINEIVITTGYLADVLKSYCEKIRTVSKITYVHNPDFRTTNYIYSIYLAEKYLNDDVFLMHGDLVFENSVVADMLKKEGSFMKISSTLPLPDKDFKAVVKNGLIKAVGIDFFESAAEAQAMYKLNKAEWRMWLDKICEFCQAGRTDCYAEKALNEITDKCFIGAFDVKNRLCTEIDNSEDLSRVNKILSEVECG